MRCQCGEEGGWNPQTMTVMCPACEDIHLEERIDYERDFTELLYGQETEG